MWISELKENEIFVFGSNESGIHGAGAAKIAREKFGAEWGVGYGRTGQCYAIPTKDKRVYVRELIEIEQDVEDFKEYARNHPELTFLLTPIGTGLAGLPAAKIGPMFKDSPENVVIPEEFKEYV